MTQADSNTITRSPVDTSRRRFLAVTAAASAVSVTALAAAAMPVSVSQSDAAVVAAGMTTPANDAALLELERQIFEQREGAGVYDDETIRLSEIWTAESNRLYKEALSREAQTGTYLTPQARWALVTDLPACIEHNRLCALQEPFHQQMEVLIAQMFAIPAHTAEGRRAKAAVLLAASCALTGSRSTWRPTTPRGWRARCCLSLSAANPASRSEINSSDNPLATDRRGDRGHRAPVPFSLELCELGITAQGMWITGDRRTAFKTRPLHRS